MDAKDITIDWNWVKRELLRKERIPSESTLSDAAEEYLKKAKGLARPRVISVKKKVAGFDAGTVRLVGPAAFNGKKLSSYIRGATHVHIFLATIGGALENAASRYMGKGDSLGGYLLDRIGSFAVESLAENFEESLRKFHAARGSSASIRISPGYCDWPIEEQFKLSKLLKFSRAGVRLTESCMMVPRKSISAIIGLGPKGLFSRERSQCAVCDIKACDYRRLSHFPQRELR